MNRQDQTLYFEGFAESLRASAAESAPGWLRDGDRERFRIYRNNVVKGHIDALAAAYPVVARLVGDAFFEAMARAYYLARPHPARSLALYGAGFDEFIQSFPPAAGLPYLSDVASLERAWLESYHAADVEPLNVEKISAFGDPVGNLRFSKHPATRLIRSEYPVYDIWRANRETGDARGVEIEAVPQSVLITRPMWDVNVIALSPNTALFAAHLLEENTLGTAYEAAAAAYPQFDVPAALAQLLSCGTFSDFKEGT